MPTQPAELVLPRQPQRVEAPAAPTLAVIIITWNRKAFVTSVLEALSRQSFPTAQLHVVVVDNCSTDGTLDHLADRFKPESIVENPTTKAHEPNFQPPTARAPGLANTLGLGSLTLVHNHANMGGCGGFNTGFAYVDQHLDRGDHPPDYVWLVDDDIDLPEDTCEHLVRAAEADHAIGLVGSRTCHINDRGTTIETTIYFNENTGLMSDEPAPGHRLYDSHHAWAKSVGGTRGKNHYTGLREVDVVSACSLLARWKLVRQIGFWDYRYFIYCDDADWCRRFAKAGHRVVLNLDAVVYHTPWHHKLTPARGYYAQRNVLWMIQKLMPAGTLKKVTLKWMLKVLRDSLYAGLHRRLFHAEIIRRSVDDVITLRWGKLDDEGPKLAPLGPAFDRAERDQGPELLRADRTVAFLLSRPGMPQSARELRERVREYLRRAGRENDEPTWIEIIRNDVPGAETELPGDVSRRVVYSRRWRSKVRRQIDLDRHPPDAVVVFDQDNDFPLLRAGWNLHVDRRNPFVCQPEKAGMRFIARFVGRWAKTVLKVFSYTARLKPYQSATKYG